MRMLGFIEKHGRKIIVALMVVSILFIMIGHMYRDQIQTKLKTEFMKVPGFSLDWWSISHFILFALFGFIEPNRPLLFLGIGVAWEVFEDGLSANKTTQLVDCQKPKTTLSQEIMCNGLEDGYWYAKWDDILCNLFGYLLGSGIRSLI